MAPPRGPTHVRSRPYDDKPHGGGAERHCVLMRPKALIPFWYAFRYSTEYDEEPLGVILKNGNLTGLIAHLNYPNALVECYGGGGTLGFLAID
jgi:hypothetical protein